MDALINWQEFRPLVSGIYKRDESNKGGQKPFDGIQMLKILILGQ
jgi:transposase, IS5 family